MSEEKGNIGAIEAYNILLQRQMSEDRIITERTSIFLAANSILFLAFIILLTSTLPPHFRILQIALPVVGMLLSILYYHLIQAAANALEFWRGGLRKIEEEAPELDYMRANEVAPHLSGLEVISAKKEWGKVDGKWQLLPSKSGWRKSPYPGIKGTSVVFRIFPWIFFIMWVVALAVVSLYRASPPSY